MHANGEGTELTKILILPKIKSELILLSSNTKIQEYKKAKSMNKCIWDKYKKKLTTIIV